MDRHVRSEARDSPGHARDNEPGLYHRIRQLSRSTCRGHDGPLEERDRTKFVTAVWLFSAAAILLFAHLGAAELRTLEGRWVAVCDHMMSSGDYLHPYLFGEPYYDKPFPRAKRAGPRFMQDIERHFCRALWIGRGVRKRHRRLYFTMRSGTLLHRHPRHNLLHEGLQARVGLGLA
jgi:hypothetical protein